MKNFLFCLLLSIFCNYAKAQFVSSGNSSSSSIYYNGTGNVGIGTNSPWSKFSVIGSTSNFISSFVNNNSGNGVEIRASRGGQSKSFMIKTTDDESDIYDFVVTTSGKVGIGSLPSNATLSIESYDFNNSYITTMSNNTYSSASGLFIKAGDINMNTNLLLLRAGFNTDQLIVKGNGKIGMGTTFTGTLPSDFNNFRLFVKDGIRTERIKVDVASSNGWADYVFTSQFKLKSLYEVEKYINTHKHLPDVPSASQLEKEGMDLGEMHKIQMQKIEELTLYLIQIKKENDELKKRLIEIEKNINLKK
jgi:hypothetical protein